MKDLNSKIVQILKRHPEGGEKFFNALDFMLRGDISIGEEFIKWVMSNIHSYASSTGIVVTGRFGHLLLSNFGKELLKFFGDVIVVNGGIREGEEPEIHKCSLLMSRYIFLDDSYYSGVTQDKIQKALKSLQPTFEFEGTYVVYDGSKGDHYGIHSMYRYYE